MKRWVFHLTEAEVGELQRPVTTRRGGWQEAMTAAAALVEPDGTWRVPEPLLRRLFRMCVTTRPRHGSYQRRLPRRVLDPVFAAHRAQWTR
jgi:hypothetical protein